MAQLKDLIVNGASRFIGDIFGNKAQLTTLDAPTAAGGSTYGPGTSGQVLKTNGTSIYWGADNNSGGTVTSVRVQATSPVVSSVNTAQTGTLNTTISLANNYGDTKNPYASKTKNYVLAAPSNANGAPSFRALVAADIPDLDTYLKKSGGTMTGALTLSGAPTADLHAATKKYVDDAFAANDAMIFKGTISGGSTGNYGALTQAASRGWTYKVDTAGKINGVAVEIGDILICLDDNTAAATSSDYATAQTHWVIVQNNVDGAVFKSSNSFTDGKVIIADGTNGKVKTSSYSLGATVSSGTANRMAYYDTGHSITSAGHYVDDDKVSVGSTNAPATDEVFYVSGNSRLKGILIQGSSSITNANVTGDHAAAFNEASAVTGQNATAFGYHTTASGSESIAFNGNTIASGDYSAAFGYKTSARGECSFAEGEGSGDITVTFSGAANATSYTSTVEISSNALNYFIGYTDATDAIILARITSINGTTFTTDKTLSSTELTNATGIVYRGVAYGKRSHVEGSGSIAFGKQSHAEGDGSAAIGDGSHAEGGHTQATGKNSHAEGYYASASGQYSHAEGRSTVASGEQAHAAGRDTIASAANAHAEGIGTIARGNNQHVFGRYNVQDSSSGSSGVYAEIVGKGTADNDRSNARTLDWSGNETLAGNLLPMGTEQNLGSSSQRWQNIYLKSGTVNYMMSRDTSASVSVVTIKNTSDESIASFGFHNTGNGGNGAMYLIPYYAGLGDDSAYEGKHGLYIGTTTFKWENKHILRYSATATDGQVIISDGTTGNVKTSGYTIGASIGTGTAQYGIAYYSTTTNITSTAQGTNGALLTGKGANAPAWKASANGAVYATSANGDLQWGTLPIAQGGTGNTSYAANRLIYSESTSKLSVTGHYADATSIAINSTTIPTPPTGYPTYNLYINGDARSSGDLYFEGTNNRLAAFKLTTVGTVSRANIDMGWDWEKLDGAGAAFRSTDPNLAANQIGRFVLFARTTADDTAQLVGAPTGELSWKKASGAARMGINADADANSILFINDGRIRIDSANQSGDGTGAFLALNSTNTTFGGFYRIIEHKAPNLQTGKVVLLALGKNADNGNQGYFGFTYNGDSSNDNFITLGMNNNDHLVRIYKTGNVSIGGAVNSYKLYVNGTSRFDDMLIVNSRSNSNAAYTTAAMQVREYGYGGAQTDNWSTAPRLGFHWGNRNAAQIGLASNGYLYECPGTGTTFYKIMFESGTWGISITGNAATATKLATARSINGTNFDGSANITTANWGTARTITIGSKGKSVNGSANVSWSLAEIGATVSNAWTAGTTAGPTIKTTVNGVTGTAVAIPTATASASGVITTGAQTWAGNKTFSGIVGVGAVNTSFRLTIQAPANTQANLYLKSSTSGQWSYIRIHNNAQYWDIGSNSSAVGSIPAGALKFGYNGANDGVWITTAKVLFGAAWNDYAEFRKTEEKIEPGRCVKENGDDTLSLTTKRLERGCEIVSDTYGFAIGQTEECQTPTAATGRVLAYLYEGQEIAKTHIGYPVCSGPNGTVSIMTEEEEEKYPSRIIGTISAVPDYEIWHGAQDVKVNGRVWIRIR